MNKTVLVAILVFSLAACGTFRPVGDYDEVIDRGTGEFAEQLNAHLKNMAELAGKPEGTYEQNFRTYNALDAKIDILIARARNGSDGKGCKLQAALFERVSALLGKGAPPQLQSGNDASPATENACNARLLEIVKDELNSIREIHRDADKCGPTHLSCIRPATAKDALAIANQSINAVAIVESAKKSQ
jgi:hypothetical protein